MQTSYPYNQPSGLHGGAYGTPVKVQSASNGVASVSVWTLTVSGATNATLYELDWSYTDDSGRLIEGTVGYTSDASATTTEIKDGLVAAWNADAQASSLSHAVSTGAATATFTTHSILVDLTIEEDSSDMSLSEAGGGTPAVIPFGDLVIPASLGDGRTAIDATAANMTAKVLTFTPLAVNNATYTMAVDIEGHGVFSGTYNADASATVAEICTGMALSLNEALPASTVIVADNTTDITLTAEIAGLGFDANGGGSLTGATWTKVVTTAGPSLGELALGVAIRDPNSAGTYNASGVAGYAAFAQMPVVQQGKVYVDTNESVDQHDQVWFGVAGDDVGLYRGSIGSTAANWLPLPKSKFSFAERISATAAILAVNAA